MADPASTGTESWREYFGFDEPYENQADAVERAIEAGKARGFLAMEGPCGTGKTMAALTAGATLVRDTDLYERLVVVTPVKQQLQQFVDDLRTLNAGIDEPFDGISLVGKRDLCPYGREGQFPDDVGTHDRCEDLREATARLVEDDGRSDGAVVADAVQYGIAGTGKKRKPDKMILYRFFSEQTQSILQYVVLWIVANNRSSGLFDKQKNKRNQKKPGNTDSNHRCLPVVLKRNGTSRKK